MKLYYKTFDLHLYDTFKIAHDRAEHSADVDCGS